MGSLRKITPSWGWGPFEQRNFAIGLERRWLGTVELLRSQRALLALWNATRKRTVDSMNDLIKKGRL